MDVSWDIPQQGQADIDQKIGAAACGHEDADGRNEDGDEDYQEGGGGVGAVGGHRDCAFGCIDCGPYEFGVEAGNLQIRVKMAECLC